MIEGMTSPSSVSIGFPIVMPMHAFNIRLIAPVFPVDVELGEIMPSILPISATTGPFRKILDKKSIDN